MKPSASTIAAALVAAVLTNAASAQESTSGAPSTPPAPNPILVPAPAKMPPIVVAAAQNVAHTIVQRKNAKGANGDPKEVFGTAADKIAIFALAAAADPDKTKAVDYAAQYIAAGETQRTDKQVGATASTSGSTSAVDKAGLPYLLGVAIDHGAINQNINGSTLTLSSSPYALLASLKGDTAETYHDFAAYTRLGLTASYDLQNQNDPLASVQRKQLSEWSLKFRLLGDHSPRSPEASAAFANQVLPALQDKANALAKALASVVGGPRARSIVTFSSETTRQINEYLDSADFSSSGAEQKITTIITDAVQQYIYREGKVMGITTADQQLLSTFLTSYKSATDAYVRSANAFDTTLAALANKPTLTLAYANERGSGTPNYSVAKLLFEVKPQASLQIDANASGSFYGNPGKSKNEQTFRDFTAALGLEQNVGRSPFLTDKSDKSQVTLSLSGRYERLQENQHTPGRKADLAVANLKLEIPIGAGVSLPLSMTYANATELIKEHEVRGNFGITFDLDKLRALAAAH
jgi:hypothetical protein